MGKDERSLTDWGDKGRHCRKGQEMWKEGEKDVILGVMLCSTLPRTFTYSGTEVWS